MINNLTLINLANKIKLFIMNKVITIFDAKTNLSKYIQSAKEGNPVYIGNYGKKEVVLISTKSTKNPIRFGIASGKFKYSDKDLEGIDLDIQKMFQL